MQRVKIPGGASQTTVLPRAKIGWRAVAAFLGAVCLASAVESTNSMYKPPQAVAGGLDPRVSITSIVKTQDTVTITWSGFLKPFTVQQTPSLTSPSWQTILSTTDTKGTVPTQGAMGLLRIQSPTPIYFGTMACRSCHTGVHDSWTNTAHAGAFETLKRIRQDKNPNCLPCHTVGYGLPTGFINESSTPELAGVQCENCHGPAGRHLFDTDDLSARPKVTIAAETCGGCHTDFHHPTYDEWKESAHGQPNPEIVSSINAQGQSRMLACGPCHAGAVRVALLGQLSVTNTTDLVVPSREDATYFPITCAVCHNPHENTLASQTRNPTYSLIPFSYSTSTNTSFAAQYNPDVQLCAQCHNLRGGRWQDTSRPPHHSPQYNMLIGNGGFDLGLSFIATHGLEIQQQCAHCHTHPHEENPPSEDSPNYTGHGFYPTLESCVECHGEGGAEGLLQFTQGRTQEEIQEVVGLLNSWATNKAPTALRDKYGPLAWEYNNPGVLSNAGTNKGPTTAEQGSVPDAIKQARFNLYLVQHDGSFGVHNGIYADILIDIAKTNAVSELAKP